jgi:thiosulfate reductase cytochrome b subunit
MTPIHLHSLVLRIWHWANTAIVVFLIVTGIQLRAPDLAIFPNYRTAVLAHKGTGFVMAISFIFWLVYTLSNQNSRRQYLFHNSELLGIVTQGRYYAFGLFKKQANPFSTTKEAKFNPLQKISYIGVQFFLTPIIVITGIFYSDILFFNTAISRLGGVKIIDMIHVIVAYLFVLYLIVHIYMSTMGHTPCTHIKAMFTGYENSEQD